MHFPEFANYTSDDRYAHFIAMNGEREVVTRNWDRDLLHRGGHGPGKNRRH